MNNTTNKTNTTAKNAVNNTEEQTSNKIEWRIIIPKINLDAPIAEGTTTEVMNKYVGHFEGSANLSGNVCLAAHNRGYPVNYFQNIKKLEKGDIIQYVFGYFKREYKVETITIISDTDWTYLTNTKENKITLITCVEDEPNYRRCIQGIEIK